MNKEYINTQVRTHTHTHTHTTLHYNRQYNTIHYRTQYITIHYNTQYNTLQYTIHFNRQYNTIHILHNRPCKKENKLMHIIYYNVNIGIHTYIYYTISPVKKRTN